jgi:hypothetical protein
LCVYYRVLITMDETNNTSELKYRIHYVELKTGEKGTCGLYPQKWKDTAFGFSDYLNRLYRATHKYYVVAVQIPVMDVKTG